MCVICLEVLANSSMEPCRLARHLKSKHADVASKDVEFFERLETSTLAQNRQAVDFVKKDKQLLRAWNKISLRTFRAEKPITIGEELIKPCILDAVEEVFGEPPAQRIRKIPLSNSSVERRIQDMSDDIEEQLVLAVKASRFEILFHPAR